MPRDPDRYLHLAVVFGTARIQLNGHFIRHAVGIYASIPWSRVKNLAELARQGSRAFSYQSQPFGAGDKIRARTGARRRSIQPMRRTLAKEGRSWMTN